MRSRAWHSSGPDDAQRTSEWASRMSAGAVHRAVPTHPAMTRTCCARSLHASPKWLLGRLDDFGLVHGDYRLDNLLFATDAGGPPCTAVDWQIVAVGLPARDLGFFLGTGLRSEERGEHERGLVAAYHDALVGYGVDGLLARPVLGRLPVRPVPGPAHHRARRHVRDAHRARRRDVRGDDRALLRGHPGIRLARIALIAPEPPTRLDSCDESDRSASGPALEATPRSGRRVRRDAVEIVQTSSSPRGGGSTTASWPLPCCFALVGAVALQVGAAGSGGGPGALVVPGRGRGLVGRRDRRGARSADRHRVSPVVRADDLAAHAGA